VNDLAIKRYMRRGKKRRDDTEMGSEETRERRGGGYLFFSGWGEICPHLSPNHPVGIANGVKPGAIVD
jgi:hypothetical protein